MKELISLTKTATTNNNKGILLTLPEADLTAPREKAKQEKSNSAITTKATKTKKLMLLKLPPGLEMTDLVTSNQCHFVVPSKNESTKRMANNNNNTSSNKNKLIDNLKQLKSDQAALVLEAKNTSYAVSRLETSNVLVMVPPCQQVMDNINTANAQQSSSSDSSSSPQSLKENDEPPASKKAKLDNSSSIRHIPTRLLQPGGSGASFLELSPISITASQLWPILQRHTFDPYHKNVYAKKDRVLGRSLPSLAQELQCSQGQVKELLLGMAVPAFPMPPSSTNNENQSSENDNDNVRKDDNPSSSTPQPLLFGTLSDRALREAQNVLIATLAESDDFDKYCEGVNVTQWLQQAQERLTAKYPEVEHVLRYAMTTFVDLVKSHPKFILEEGQQVALSVQKIAICLAHRLFQMQIQPWEDKKFFLRWQSELPGVEHRINMEWLQGMAIPVANVHGSPLKHDGSTHDDGQEKYWKYVALVPGQSADQCFHKLFAAQEHYSKQQLQPYVDRLALDTGVSQADLMSHYTKMETTEDGIELYSLKNEAAHGF